MSKYDKLTEFLSEISEDRICLTFDEVDSLVDGGLPESARNHRPWWANRTEGRGSQNLSWQSVGWETRDVDMDLDEVTFVRVKTKAPPVGGHAKHGITIAEAKAGLAVMFGVDESQIEISIRA
jgi:hypothetical protein